MSWSRFLLTAFSGYCCVIAHAHATQPVPIKQVKFADPHFRACVLKLHKKYFTDIHALNCDHGSVSRTDELKYMTNIKSLSLRDNHMTRVDISHNPQLLSLNLSSNAEMAIDLSHNPKLREVYLAKTRGHLDVSHNPQLESLSVAKLRQHTLVLSHNPKLSYLHISSDSITSIDVSKNPQLYHLYVSAYFVRSIGIKTIDLSHNHKLTYLNLDYASLTALNLTNNPLLEEVHLHKNHLQSLTLAPHNPLSYLDISDNNLTDLDLSRAKKLSTLIAFNNAKLHKVTLAHADKMSMLSFENTPYWEKQPSWRAKSISRLYTPHFRIVGNGKITEESGADTTLDSPFIVARLGDSFGIDYTVSYSADERKKSRHLPDKLPVFVRMTHPKLVNIATGAISTITEWQDVAYQKNSNLSLWIFEDPRELESGPWKIEMFYNQRLVAEQSFFINVARSGTDIPKA